MKKSGDSCARFLTRAIKEIAKTGITMAEASRAFKIKEFDDSLTEISKAVTVKMDKPIDRIGIDFKLGEDPFADDIESSDPVETIGGSLEAVRDAFSKPRTPRESLPDMEAPVEAPEPSGRKPGAFTDTCPKCGMAPVEAEPPKGTSTVNFECPNCGAAWMRNALDIPWNDRPSKYYDPEDPTASLDEAHYPDEYTMHDRAWDEYEEDIWRAEEDRESEIDAMIEADAQAAIEEEREIERMKEEDELDSRYRSRFEGRGSRDRRRRRR